MVTINQNILFSRICLFSNTNNRGVASKCIILVPEYIAVVAVSDVTDPKTFLVTCNTRDEEVFCIVIPVSGQIQYDIGEDGVR